jgi:hypothetical protein
MKTYREWAPAEADVLKGHDFSRAAKQQNEDGL